MSAASRRLLGCTALLAVTLLPAISMAQGVGDVGPDVLGEGAVALVQGTEDMPVSAALRLVLILTAMTFLPAVLLVMTPFTRFVIVFSLLRQALGLQQSPPNQVLIGLSLFLSMLVMQKPLQQVNDNALQPYLAGEMETGTAIELGMQPMRGFMLHHITREDLSSVISVSGIDKPDSVEDLPTSVVVSTFVLSELRAAFVIAIKVYIPFLVIDLVVASVLLGMGMMVLPPVVISLPFKLLLFVLMDGWGLLVTSLVKSFG